MYRNVFITSLNRGHIKIDIKKDNIKIKIY